MSHKFKVGDKVRVKHSFDPVFYGGIGEVGAANHSYVHPNDPNRLSPVPLYEIKLGQQIIYMLEDGLEKIEEPKRETKYKIGDRVIFTCFDDDHLKGEIKHVANREEPVYTIRNEAGYPFILEEEKIIGLAPSPEFKEGDEVWIKGKIGVWSSSRNIIDDEKDIKVFVKDDIFWCKEQEIFKSLPPKNEWVSVKDRFPTSPQYFLVMRKDTLRREVQHQDVAYYSVLRQEFIYRTGESVRNVTHWKPLDAPPS